MKRKCLIVYIVPLVLFLAPFWGECADKAASLQKLYQAAKQEGKIVVHSGATIELFTPLADLFKKRYPGIEVQLIAVPSPKIATQIITEAAAGKVTIDVAKGEVEYYTNELMKRNLMRKINLSDVMDVDPANVYLDGRLYQEDNKVTVIGYNSNLVPPADVPKTWEDLLNPKWKGGKMFFTQQGLSLSALWPEWGESKTTEYLKKLKEQGLVITISPRPGADKLANSEAYLACTFASTLYTVLKAGAPVAISPISPQMVLVAGTYAMENSPHPNAAKLWVAWSQTPEARAARWEYIGETMAKPPESTAVTKLIHEKGLKLWYVATPEIAAMRGENQTKTQKLLGIVPK